MNKAYQIGLRPFVRIPDTKKPHKNPMIRLSLDGMPDKPSRSGEGYSTANAAPTGRSRAKKGLTKPWLLKNLKRFSILSSTSDDNILFMASGTDGRRPTPPSAVSAPCSASPHGTLAEDECLTICYEFTSQLTCRCAHRNWMSSPLASPGSAVCRPPAPH